MPSRTPRKTGVALMNGGVEPPEHELAVHQGLAIRIATLLGTRFLDEDESLHTTDSNLYYLPTQTLIDSNRYRAMGILTVDDFFGGLVDRPFMATKAISHVLPEQAAAVEGWTPDFARVAGDALLEGFTVFNLADALVAGQLMLQTAPLRVKPVRATAGRGQVVIHDRNELDLVLSQMDEEEVTVWGLVLEENLSDVQTYSVGQVQVAGITASYFGKQSLTRDNDGIEVYGGSELVVTRGDYSQLLQLDMDAATRLAVQQAQRYEQAAVQTLDGFLASRRNYDIARGTAHDGRVRSGVMEQSWRVGGASSAEILALEAFAADPKLNQVIASTHEIFGDCVLPADATLFYQGNDAAVGPISKYARIRTYEHKQ